MPYPALEEFQIGWICALPIEVAAAKEMLDENWGLLQEQNSADTNTYTLGRIGVHNVAIACLAQYGTTSAAIVANNMVRTFSSSLRIGLMVGIGGGMPSATHDIRLGDIVISYPENTCGGVLQHDMGKIEQGGRFRRTGSLNSPPRPILNALNSMRGALLTDDPQYPEYMASAANRTPRTQKTFHYPGSQSDRLFKFEYDHPSPDAPCDECSPEWEETRPEREDNGPQLHYGIIASGNTVIKDGQKREQLRQETGALCFEMEAAGLMLDFPCIVIRGISDYADSHKNKHWQGYAALAAASYAKELLGYLPRSQITQQKLVKEVCGIAKGLEDINRGIKRHLDQHESYYQEHKSMLFTEKQQRCHQAFKTSPYEQHKNINPNRVKGTCQWVLKNELYHRWLESKRDDLLWISADPGCGKSVLAKSLIDIDLESSGSTASICYFFFKDNDQQNRLTTALCAMLHQLFLQQPRLLKYALSYWEKNGDQVQREVDALWNILIAATSDPEASAGTTCVFDALDERCQIDQRHLIRRLEDFLTIRLSSQKTPLKFLVTSRPYDNIREGFQAIINSFSHVHLPGEIENHQIHQEINLVVKIKVKELAETLALRPKVAEELEKRLLEMRHRTYLWLYLAMDDIRTTFRNSLRPDKEKIQLIPASVNEAYENILSRVPPGQEENVRKILQIITGARRPLTLQEMAMALGIAISPDLETAEEARLDVQQLDGKIRHLCGLFVYIADRKLHLIHHTAREFLLCRQSTTTSPYHFEFSDVESQMAEVCVRYLVMHDLEDSRAQRQFDVQCFLEYAAEHWPDHVRNMSSLSEWRSHNVLYELYTSTSSRLWFPYIWDTRTFRGDPEDPEMSPLHLAAFNGHTSILKRLITEYNGNIDVPDNAGITALLYSSRNGYHDIVTILLAEGADANYRRLIFEDSLPGQPAFITPLQIASSRGYEKIVAMLLENGADPNASDWSQRTALHAASRNGHEKIVEILLENGANPNIKDNYTDYATALILAAENGFEKIVQMLLAYGANPNIAGGHRYSAPLQLENGPFRNMAAQWDYKTPLIVAATNGYGRIVNMLLKAGANVTNHFYVNGKEAVKNVLDDYWFRDDYWFQEDYSRREDRWWSAFEEKNISTSAYKGDSSSYN